ncbi:potassium channel family protein [Methyloligella sp. 2.7D]|uniref:potassium channel family protein n=1 Tax=unclassified Methyloligella TaxID=2625955 RepID=UPI00157C7D4E|nr:potassium channel family protein [Methyloligella sp. GL2]QKP77272.1 two pore domain potassium channel family protein [Methyloligella sp. GL2]
MLTQIILGSAMIVITTFIQGLFAVTGIERLREHLKRHPTSSLPHGTLKIAALVLWLFLGTITEVWSWAVLYLALGTFDTLEHAVYFSTVTFTTLGFGDITLDEEWRLLSSFEAANGLLLFGWSTALVFVGVKWVYRADV